MTASIPLGDLRHGLLPTMLAFILILSCSAVHAATPGEEHTHTVFQDDFEDWDEDAWEMLIAPDASYGASWKVLDDDGNKVLSLKGTVLAAAGNMDWTDYTLMVRVRLVDVPDGARICVRVREEGQMYVAFGENDLMFTKEYPDRGYEIAKMETAYGDAVWHVFKVVCVGGGFWVYVDDEPKIEYMDEDDPVLSGRIGFSCGPSSNAYFDDVRVTVTHLDYVGYLIDDAEEAIEAARTVEADVVEPETMLKEARAKLEEGDLGAAETLSRGAAAKAYGNMALKVSATQEQPSGDQQASPAQPGAALSVERVATLVTIGGAAVGAVGWTIRARGDRRRRAILFRELMRGVDDAYNRFRMNASQCEAELYGMKDRAIVEFKQGMISEENYQALVERIEEHLGKLKGEAV